MIGSVLDKYEVLQKVGEGGMATVYRGRHTTLDRQVAIKVLHPHLSSSTRNRKRFAREARAIEHLRHKNILEIFDYSGIDSTDCYIITEFVPGQTLTSLTEEAGTLPSELVSMIGIKLCEALEYAHQSGILHRDLKPENVMVRNDGRLKLMDFGIARFLDESQVTLTGALIGSPAFMSPEQAREDKLDARSDLFSLGTVLFYLVTGCLPFTGTNPSLILKKVIEGERPAVTDLCPEMSATLADAIERLLCTEPDGRFNHAREAGEVLADSLYEVGIEPDDPTWTMQAYLQDPIGYREQLDAHVRVVLLECGRSKLEQGEALVALRLFNRLLSLDDGNEEVLALVQSLHTEPDPVANRPSPWLWAVALSFPVLILTGLVVWDWQRDPTPTAPPPRVKVEVEPPPERIEPEIHTSPMPILPRSKPMVAKRFPRPTVARPRPELPVPTGPATVRLISRLTAGVFLDGKKLGTTRTPLTLEPGSYELQVRGDVVMPRTVRLEVGPGDNITIPVQLVARPAIVKLSDRFEDACTAVLDGEPLGDMVSLHRRLTVRNPERVGHKLIVACPDRPDFQHIWNSVVFPGDRIGD